ncbi:NAD(P)/FAD-dependent oxidoreductase [Woodsholea maritima]|uniref:NAD(P)/FAD-dependent oxidoreductase n=1 Tax=Woodsholea maritima TaxID=240237 RepID=UPI000475C418|nr:FAD-dependent oxidoreductase [Woodsholea maritima]
MPFDHPQPSAQNIAIIGGGISGLAAAWALSPHHKITLFEAQERIGGHARTVVAGRRGDQPVDTGFIVFNYATYPHLTGLFRDLDIPVERSDMSFGVSLEGGKVELGFHSAGGIFAQRTNLFRPSIYAMIKDILTYNKDAEAAVRAHPGLTIGALLDQLGLGQAFRTYYLYPMCAAIWSTPPQDIEGFPAEALIRFMRNHALMSVGHHHPWWTVKGGSQTYVKALVKALDARGVEMRVNCPITSVRRDTMGVSVKTARAEVEVFDQVIFACHSDEALQALKDPSPAEHKALSAVRFQDNHAVLHCDPQVMPKRRACWCSWVYQTPAGHDPAQPVGVSYWMNRLQNIPDDDPMFVTLNPVHEIAPERIYDQVTFRHPVFDQGGLQAQDDLRALQGQNRTWFAGAWLRNGFHEDGFASAMRIARQLNRNEALL